MLIQQILGRWFQENCRPHCNWTSCLGCQPSRGRCSRWYRISSAILYSLACSCRSGCPCSGPSIWMLFCSYYSRCRSHHAPWAIGLPFLGCGRRGMQQLMPNRRRRSGRGTCTSCSWSHCRPRTRTICSWARYSDERRGSRTRTDSCTMGNRPWRDRLGLLQMEFCRVPELLKYNSSWAQLAKSYPRSMPSWHSRMELSASMLAKRRRHHRRKPCKSYYQRTLKVTKYHHEYTAMQKALLLCHHLPRPNPKRSFWPYPSRNWEVWTPPWRKCWIQFYSWATHSRNSWSKHWFICV